MLTDSLSHRQRIRRALLEMLPKNSTGAEIGVSSGDFSQEILNVVSPRELVLIDPWDHLGEQTDGEGYKWFLDKEQMRKTYLGVVERFKQQQGVTVVRGFSQEVLQRYSDSYFDWVYLDAAHDYESVLCELIVCIKKVKAGGFITGDDLFKSKGGRKGVQDAVLDTLQVCGLRRKLKVIRDNPPKYADRPSRLGQQFIFRVTQEMKSTLISTLERQ